MYFYIVINNSKICNCLETETVVIIKHKKKIGVGE